MPDTVTRPAGTRFALHCIGDVRLYRDGADCTPKSKKGRALLAVLAAEQRPLTRVRIVDLLWSDRQEEQARASLRTLLADLRDQFDEDFDDLLIADRERIALAEGVRTDLADPTLARPAGELFEGLDHIDPELDDWLRTERQKWSGHGPAQRPAPAVTEPRRRLPQWALLAVLLLALAAGALLYVRPWAAPEQPVVAVLPLRDATGQNALLADGLAEDLRIHLAERDGLQVIGRQSSEVPAVIAGGAAGARRMLGATHLVEGSILPGNPARVSVRLVRADGGKVIWNHVAAAQPNLVTYGPSGLAKVIADQVTDTVEQSGPGYAFEADPASYQKLFEARRMLARLDSAKAPEARQLLLAVVERNPRFAPALANLAEATFRSSDHPFYRGPMPLQQARKEAERYAQQAIRLAPDFGPAYLALGQARLDTPQALKPLRRAVELSPGNFRARYRLARALEASGDFSGALEQQRIATRLEPLDPNAAGMLVQYLANFDRRAEMRTAVREFVARSDNPLDKIRVSKLVAGMLGDMSAALVFAVHELKLQPTDEQTRRGAMWGYLQLHAREQAGAHAQEGSLSALILNDDLPGLLNKNRELGADFWLMNYETTGAAEYLVQNKRTRELVDSYYGARKSLSDDRAGIGPLIVALRAEGENAEAQRLLQEYEKWLERATKALPERVRKFAYVEYWALAGEKQRAISALETAHQLDWSWLSGTYSPGLQSTVFLGLRDDERFKRLAQWYYVNLNRERREAAAQLQKLGMPNEARALMVPIEPGKTA